MPVPPPINSYWRFPKGAAHPLISRAGRAYRKDVQTWLQIARLEYFGEDDVSVTAVVYFKDRRRDLDGAVKVLLDVLQGWVYKNDRQVAHIEFTRALDRKNPRVEITVEAVTDVLADPLGGL